MAAVATAAVSIIAYWHARDTPPNSVLEGEQAIPKGATDTRALRKPEWRELFANRNLLLLTVGYFTLNYFEYIFFYWIYYYFGEVRGLGRDMSAIYTTVLLLTMMVMMPLGGWLADRLIPRWGPHVGRRRVAVTGMALSIGRPAKAVKAVNSADPMLVSASIRRGPYRSASQPPGNMNSA